MTTDDTLNSVQESPITGREPRLATHSRAGQRRLSLRGLATLLNVLPPESISLEAAATALRSKDFFVRYHAARSLGRRADRDARLILQEALDEDSAPVRASAVRELHRFTWFAAEPLLRRALRDADPRVREGAVYALCDLRDLHAYQLLTETLYDEADRVRAAAAWGLREQRDPAAVPVLEAIVTRATDPEVRVSALEALGVNGTPQALPIVRATVDDPDPDVEYAATLSWLELAGAGCLPELADLIQRKTGPARQHLLRGFFHATNYLQIDLVRSPAIDALLAALEVALHDDLPAARMAAAWPLAWIVHPRAALLLEQAYQREQDVEVKAHLVRVAVGLMSPAGDTILQNALNSPDETVRQAAEIVRLASATRRIDEVLPPGEGPIWKR